MVEITKDSPPVVDLNINGHPYKMVFDIPPATNKDDFDNGDNQIIIPGGIVRDGNFVSIPVPSGCYVIRDFEFPKQSPDSSPPKTS